MVRELFHEIRDPVDGEPPDERRPEIVREDAEQRRDIRRVGASNHLVEGGLVAGLDEIFDPGRGVTQAIRREIDGEGFSLPVGLSRQFIVFDTVV